MRWDCAKNGCFNAKKRIKLGHFDGCFGRRIAFGDLDAIVEVGGAILVMEWKGYTGPIPRGQAILHDVLARKGIVVLVVEGDAETMDVSFVTAVWKARDGEVKRKRWASGLEELKARIAAWAESHGGGPQGHMPAVGPRLG